MFFFLEWYTPWSGMYKVLPSLDALVAFSASPSWKVWLVNFVWSSLYLGFLSNFIFKCFNQTSARYLFLERWGEALERRGISRCPPSLYQILSVRSCKNWKSSWDMSFSFGFVSRKSISNTLITSDSVIKGSSFTNILWQNSVIYLEHKCLIGPTILQPNSVFTVKR